MLSLEKTTTDVEETIIYQKEDLTLLRITTESSRFEDVLCLRKEHSEDVTDSFDHNASIYVLYREDVPLGTARFLQAHTSRLDFEETLPFVLEQRFRRFICSGSRLVITQKQRTPVSLGALLLGLAGQDLIYRGTRLDLSACQEKLIPYYKRMGHQLLSYPPITHPRTGANCYLMLLLTTLRNTKLASSYFTHLPEKLEGEVLEFLEIISGSQFTSLL